MTRPSFSDPSDLWEKDGSLRDVYITGTSEQDWRGLLKIAGRYQHFYRQNGDIAPVPDVLTIFEKRDVSHLLSILVGGAQVNCHFFMFSEIELDIDPREIVDSNVHDQVMEFLELLAYETNKGLALTAENSPEAPYLSYEPSTSIWKIHLPPIQDGL
jgi:hypothetical protein